MIYQEDSKMTDSKVALLLTDTLSGLTSPEVLNQIVHQADEWVALQRTSFWTSITMQLRNMI